MLTCIIVDDESSARSELKYVIEKYHFIKIVAEASSAEEALKIYRKTRVDLMFIDIKMPQISGLELAEILMNQETAPKVVITTAFSRHAIHAFKVNALDYILKPIDEEAFDTMIQSKIIPLITQDDSKEKLDELSKRLENIENTINENSILVIPVGGDFIPINYDDIIYVTIENGNIIIQTICKQYMTYGILSEVEKQLNNRCFFRSHRSFIINLNHIKTIESATDSTFHLRLDHTNERIPVSRSYIKEFKQLMNYY